ncbi:dockerin type I repeat-containing protein, partial [Ruminococcus flavefaciens]
DTELHTNLLALKEKYVNKEPAPSKLMGDANKDGAVNVADLIMVQQFLLGNTELTDWEAADVIEDSIIDIYDMILLRKMLIVNH